MNEEGKHKYRLQGLSCANCAAKFEKNIRGIETVEDVQLNFGASKLAVTGNVTVAELEAAGAFDGIKVYPEHDKSAQAREPFWQKRETKLTAASLFLLIAGFVASAQTAEGHVLPVALFAASIVIGGWSLFKVGIANLFRLEFDMKTLMTVAIIGAALIGEWGEGAVVVFLFAISEALEGYSMDKARQSIRSLMDIAPDTALVKRNGELHRTAVEDVQIGDVMAVKPGQKIALDGEVVTGHSSVNQAAITGESVPAEKNPGDAVFAGSLNEEGYLEVRVTKRSHETKIAQIIHLVEEAQAERAPSQAFVDRFAKYYTPAIMIVALLVSVIPPLFTGDWTEWIYRGLAVLVVGCPCALVISTPVAIVTAIGNAAKNGVLIKGGIHLEETGRLNAIAFDKTGTLTEGKPAVTNIISVSDWDEETVLTTAAALESFSQHPLAEAVLQKAAGRTLPEAVHFQSLTGKGAKAEIDGVVYQIGSPKLFDSLLSSQPAITNQITVLQQEGKTVMIIGTETELKGLIAAADSIRPSSRSIIEKLKQAGIEKTIMLTGDNQAAAESIGRELRLSDVKAELMPEDKLQAIQSLQEKYGRVGMVGDGINDAPALASSTVGIAMGGAGTDTALETADIALMSDDLEKLPYTISLSRRTLTIIKQNIAFAFGLKLLALLLIIPGWLTLWLAVFADVGSTLLVVLNAMRLIRHRV